MMCMHNVKRFSLESQPRGVFGISAATVALLSFFPKLSKAGGLIISLAWLVLDLLDIRAGVPGPGTLALAYVTIVINLLVVLLEMASWLLIFPKAWANFRGTRKVVDESACVESGVVGDVGIGVAG